MANIRKIEGKRGVSYKITVTKGRDTAGKQIRHFMTWKPEPGMTARQTEKALQRAAVEFERQIDLGLRPDDRQTFQQYAAYVVECKRAAGSHLRTLDYYNEHLTRINAAIGHLKLQDIRPQHLNLFYGNLAETALARNSVAHIRVRPIWKPWRVCGRLTSPKNPGYRKARFSNPCRITSRRIPRKNCAPLLA